MLSSGRRCTDYLLVPRLLLPAEALIIAKRPDPEQKSHTFVSRRGEKRAVGPNTSFLEKKCSSLKEMLSLCLVLSTISSSPVT